MLGASISKEKVKSVTVSHLFVIFSLSLSQFVTFSPLIGKTQPICYAAIPS